MGHFPSPNQRLFSEPPYFDKLLVNYIFFTYTVPMDYFPSQYTSFITLYHYHPDKIMLSHIKAWSTSHAIVLHAFCYSHVHMNTGHHTPILILARVQHLSCILTEYSTSSFHTWKVCCYLKIQTFTAQFSCNLIFRALVHSCKHCARCSQQTFFAMITNSFIADVGETFTWINDQDWSIAFFRFHKSTIP